MSHKSEFLEKIEFEFEQIETTELDIIDTLNKIKATKKLDAIQIRAAAGSLHSICNRVSTFLSARLWFYA